MEQLNAATEAFLQASANSDSQSEPAHSTGTRGVDLNDSLDSLSGLFGAESVEDSDSTLTEEELIEKAFNDSERNSDTNEDNIDSDSDEDNNNDDSDEPVFTLKVDGKDIEVKQSELLADAQKYKAANLRFDEASALRKEAEDIKSAYSQERELLQQVLSQYQQFVESAYKEQQPDWNYLFQTDKLEYFAQKELWSQKLAQAEQAKQYQKTLQTQQAKEQEAQAKKMIQEQQAKVFEMFPERKNKDVARNAATQIDTFLKDSGFNEAERNSLNDARLLAVAHKAALYDKLVKSVPAKGSNKKTNSSAGKTINSGTGSRNSGSMSTTESRQIAKEKTARQQFNANPNVDTLSNFFK